jgi:hypothetical protein
LLAPSNRGDGFGGVDRHHGAINPALGCDDRPCTRGLKVLQIATARAVIVEQPTSVPGFDVSPLTALILG